MPFDANGNFSLVPGTIVADGLNILPSQHNPSFQDVANGLSQVVVRDGRAPMTGPLNMNGYKITGVAAGSQPTDVVTFADISDLGVAIGDGKWSLRDLSPNWLRRDGSIYEISDYPELAALLPALPDGMEISEVHTGAGPIVGSCFGGGQYVFTASDGKATTSADLENFSTGASGVSALGKVVFGNGIFVSATGTRNVAISVNGSSFSNVLVFPSGILCSDVYFDGTDFYAIGSRNENPVDLYIYKSSDGNTWSDVSPTHTPPHASQWITGNGTRLLAKTNNGLFYSDNSGSSWTMISPSPAPGSNEAGFVEGKYYSVGPTGSILDSTNGTSWTNRTSGTSAALYSVAASPLAVVAVGDSGAMRMSTNSGSSWFGIATGVTSTLRGILVSDDDEAVFAWGDSNGSIYRGVKTSADQFRVPNDGPNEWVRAL